MIARKYNIYSTGPQGDVVCNGQRFFLEMPIKEVKRRVAAALGVPVEALMVEPTNEIKTLE